MVLSCRPELLVSPVEAIVPACLEGDPAAWRTLHRRYYPVAASFLRKLGVKDADLDDAAQDVFLQMFRYLPQFRGEADLKTWLYRLCMTQARRTRRRSLVADTLRRLLALAAPGDLVSSPGFQESLVNERIHQALSALPVGERDVFVLYELEGLPGKQIAEIVGCPEASVWRRLHYARRAFKAALSSADTATPGATAVPAAGKATGAPAASPVIKRAPRAYAK